MIPDNIVPIIVALLGSGIWSAMFDYLKIKNNKVCTEKKMLLGLAHDRLYNLLDAYLRRGYITVDELENVEYLYKPYREMGGNGTCERMYEQANLLPHKKEEDDGDK